MYYARPGKPRGVASKPPRGSRRAAPRPVRNGKDPAPAPIRRHRRLRLVPKLALALLVLLILEAGALYALPVSVFGSHDGAMFAAESGYDDGCTHILLIGVDINASGTSRSDTMMILSIGERGYGLTSLQRDTGVYIEGYSGLQRLNAAYSYGGSEGPALLLRTVNLNFGLNITRYILVNYDSFTELIDSIGGVDIADVREEELPSLNHNMHDVLYRRYAKGSLTADEAQRIFDSAYLRQGGNLHMNGLQALGYARIRNIDSDYMRTSRQRKVVNAALTAIKNNLKRPARLIRAAAGAFSAIKTNMSTQELLCAGTKLLAGNSFGQTRLPVSGTYTDDGSMFYNVDYAANHAAFERFVTGTY